MNKIVRDTYHNEGVKGFYRGFIPSIFMSTYGIIQMFCYENINHIVGYNQKSNHNSWLPFFTGGISKCAASVSLLPVNVVRMRLQMKNYTVEQIKELGLSAPTNVKD